MVKTRIAIVALFLFAILIPMSLMTSVKAAHVNVAWGEQTTQPNWYEQQADSYTTSYITSLYGGSSWYSADFYGSMTTGNNVYQANANIGNSPYYDYTATFHVGDMYPDWISYGHWEVIGWHWDDDMGWVPDYGYFTDGYVRHYAYYDNYVTPGVQDYILQYYTNWKNQFTFIWTCVNGDWIGTSMDQDANHQLTTGFTIDNYYYWDPYGTGLVGMPAAWTHDYNMSPDGYANPDSGSMCFIGFENTSRGLCDQREFITSNYGDFVRAFYTYALYYHIPISTALDLAMMSNGVYGGFVASQLYNGYWDDYGYFCRMHVYGDGANILPY